MARYASFREASAYHSADILRNRLEELKREQQLLEGQLSGPLRSGFDEKKKLEDNYFRLYNALPPERQMEQGILCHHCPDIITRGCHSFSFKTNRTDLTPDERFELLRKVTISSGVMTKEEVDDFVRHYLTLTLQIPQVDGSSLEVRAASIDGNLILRMFVDILKKRLAEFLQSDAIRDCRSELDDLLRGNVPYDDQYGECDVFHGKFGEVSRDHTDGPSSERVWWPQNYLTYLRLYLRSRTFNLGGYGSDFAIHVEVECPWPERCTEKTR